VTTTREKLKPTGPTFDSHNLFLEVNGTIIRAASTGPLPLSIRTDDVLQAFNNIADRQNEGFLIRKVTTGMCLELVRLCDSQRVGSWWWTSPVSRRGRWQLLPCSGLCHLHFFSFLDVPLSPLPSKELREPFLLRQSRSRVRFVQIVSESTSKDTKQWVESADFGGGPRSKRPL
jgi:hypothetical protein